MITLNADEIRALIPIRSLVDALGEAFRSGAVDAQRHTMPMPGGAGDRLFMFMRAFEPTGGAVVKLVTIIPDNRRKDLRSVQAAVIVFSDTGTPVAMLDGTTVTHLRTGAASALASTFLSREDSTRLVIVGTGALAPTMAEAHCAVRPISHVSVWGRSPAHAAATAAAIRQRVSSRIEVTPTGSLAEATARADVISCSTSSLAPLLQGAWLKAGTFVDLVGSYLPSMREADDEVFLRSRIFVDTFHGALTEAGDLLDPISRGVIERARIEGELADLVRGKVAGRSTAVELITFKSVGTALEDWAAARLIVAAAKRTGDA